MLMAADSVVWLSVLALAPRASAAQIASHALGSDPPATLETAVALTGDPTLALRLGQRIGIESYGTFGFTLMSCANLRESTELCFSQLSARFKYDGLYGCNDGVPSYARVSRKGGPVHALETRDRTSIRRLQYGR